MKHRSVVGVILLTIITLGIYQLVWMIMTKLEMNRLGAKIPTAWLIIIPLVNIWWLWKYSEGVEQITGNRISTILAFVLLWLVPLIDMPILQHEFNKVGASPQPGAPVAPVAPVAPAVPAQAPANPVVTEQAPAAPVEPAAPAPVVPETPAAPAVPTPQPEVVSPVVPPTTTPTAPVAPTPVDTETPQTPPTPPTQPIQ